MIDTQFAHFDTLKLLTHPPSILLGLEYSPKDTQIHIDRNIRDLYLNVCRLIFMAALLLVRNARICLCLLSIYSID